MRRLDHKLHWGALASLMLAGCGGGGGDGSGSSATMPTPAPSVTVSVSPTTIALGQSATVTWSSGASSSASCSASGAWSGSLAASGSKTVTPTAAGSDLYTVSCSSGGGGYGGSSSSASNSATLTVSGPVSASSAYSLTALVSNTAGGTAVSTDTHLVNPWGVSIPSGNFAAWVANNGTQSSTLYDGNGKAQPASAPLVVTFAASAGGTAFDPTGIVFNGSSTNFTVTSGGKSGAAAFIFSGEGGMIAGWSPAVSTTQGITTYADTAGAVYKGLALAENAGQAFLYATDFHNAKVDVFNASFVKQATSSSAFTFQDPGIPAGYAPFGIQAIANGTGGATQIYVTYAEQQSPDNHDNVNGAGLGYVDVYDTNGQLIKELVVKGALNAPWGIALAPGDFGSLSNDLLIGNFGDGKINAFNPSSGALAGTVSNAGGTAIATPGLWGIAFGNDADNQPHNTLFFAAGPNNESDGLYGRIDPGATPPVLDAAPVVTLTVPSGTLSGTVTLSATVQDSIAITQVQFLANGQAIGSASSAPFSISWNTTAVANGTVSLTAKATDADGNVGTSAAASATVGNQSSTPQVTLSQLQTQVFTPICSGCHTGIGSSLPGVQNLTAGHTYASIVNVPSIEQPNLLRIKPNDPSNSYLIQKIEGAPGISGSRMPFGCGSSSDPCLDQATINMFIQWVNEGAPND
jgi:uncharacterized protein (TIGR03118 family)